MPTDPPENTPPDPSTPPAADPSATPPPAGAAPPTRDEVKGWVKEALSDLLAGGSQPEGAPDLSTDKKIEAYVEAKVTEGMKTLREAEAAAGKTPPDPTPDPTPTPDTPPEKKGTWQQKLSKALWGEVG